MWPVSETSDDNEEHKWEYDNEENNQLWNAHTTQLLWQHKVIL